jgi:hypothetical protein
MSLLALHDRLMPCRTDSARRRHTTLTQQCAACGVDGAVSEYVWRGQPTTPALRAPQVTRRNDQRGAVPS